MGIFFNKKVEKELALFFDIGSSSVGGAVFEIQKSGIPKMILSIREPILLEEKIDTDRFMFLTIESLKKVANKISLKGIGKITKIFCVLSSPWYASQTRIIKLEKNVPFVFTSKLADDLIKKEIGIFEEEHLAKFYNTEDSIRPIEFKNVKTMLNGYPTSDPHNKKTKKLEMFICISMSGDKILKKIEDVIFKYFHSKDVRFSSFAMASFVVARDIFMLQKDFLLIDIAGEVTDISVVKEDILSSSISFPLGLNFLIRKVADKLACSLSESKSLISLYKDKHAISSIEKKLEPVMKELKKEWLDNFQNSLVVLSENISVPANIFITVDEDFSHFFKELIESEHFNQHILTQSKFKITLLNIQTLHGYVAFKNEAERNPFLMIESIYLNRFIC